MVIFIANKRRVQMNNIGRIRVYFGVEYGKSKILTNKISFWLDKEKLSKNVNEMNSFNSNALTNLKLITEFCYTTVFLT